MDDDTARRIAELDARLDEMIGPTRRPTRGQQIYVGDAIRPVPILGGAFTVNRSPSHEAACLADQDRQRRFARKYCNNAVVAGATGRLDAMLMWLKQAATTISLIPDCRGLAVRWLRVLVRYAELRNARRR